MFTSIVHQLGTLVAAHTTATNGGEGIDRNLRTSKTANIESKRILWTVENYPAGES